MRTVKIRGNKVTITHVNGPRVNVWVLALATYRHVLGYD